MRQIPPVYVLEWMANFRKGFFSNSIHEPSIGPSFKKAAFTFSKTRSAEIVQYEFTADAYTGTVIDIQRLKD